MLDRFLRFFYIVAAPLGVIALLLAGATYLVLGQFDRPVLVLLILGIGLIVLSIVDNPRGFLNMLTGRAMRQGANTTIASIALIGIIVVANVLSQTYFTRWDVTEAKSFTLAPQTIQILHSLPQHVTAISFAGPDPQTNAMPPEQRDVENLLNEFQRNSNGKFSYQVVNPYVDVAAVQKYQPSTARTIVLTMGDNKRQEVLGTGETDLVNGLMRLTNQQQPKVYFVVGHGERSTSGTANPQSSLSAAGQALTRDNFSVADLNLTTTKVPTDTTVLVIADPQRAYAPEELKAIQEYLVAGGKALFLLNQGDEAQKTGIAGLLKPWGITVLNGFVVEPDQNFHLPNNQLEPVVYGSGIQYSPITKDLQNSQIAFLSNTQGQLSASTGLVLSDTPPQGATLTPLLQSSSTSWLETDPAANTLQYNEGKDRKGPITLAASVDMPVSQAAQAITTTGTSAISPTLPVASDTKAEPHARIVVVANTDFIVPVAMQSQQIANYDFFVNSVNWLSETEDLISIRPKDNTDRSLHMSPLETNLVFYTTALFLPLGILLLGGVVWWMKR